MIKLCVEEKCSNCGYFYPEVLKLDTEKLERNKETKLIQTVHCKHKELCKNIERHLKEIN